MDTPSVVYYEHDFNDSEVKSLAKSVLNLGNECRALAEENARLKAEVERLKFTHDDDTCPHLVVLGRMEAENARLKAEVERLKSLCDNLGMGGKHTITAIEAENARLKSEVERLERQNETYNDVTADIITERDSLKAEVERLNNLIISGGAVNPDASVYIE